MAGSLSPIRKLAETLEKIIDHRKCKIDEQQSTLIVLKIVQNYLINYDLSWTAEQQKYHLNALADEIELELSNASLTSVNTQQTINDAFDHLIRTIEHCQHISLDDLNQVTLAIDELRQTVVATLSKVFAELNTLHSKLDVLTSKMAILEAQSGAMKKMNFIADIFVPLVSLLNEKLVLSNIPIHSFYRQDNLEQIKRYLFSGDVSGEEKGSVARV